MSKKDMKQLVESYGRHAPIFARLLNNDPPLEHSDRHTLEDLSYFQVFGGKKTVSPSLLARNSGRTVEAVAASLAVLEDEGLVIVRRKPWGKKWRETAEVVETPIPIGPRWKNPPRKAASAAAPAPARKTICMDEMARWHGRHGHVCGQMYLDSITGRIDHRASSVFFTLSELQVKGGYRTASPRQIADAMVGMGVEQVESHLATLEEAGYAIVRRSPSGTTAEVVETSALDWSTEFLGCYDLEKSRRI